MERTPPEERYLSSLRGLIELLESLSDHAPYERGVLSAKFSNYFGLTVKRSVYYNDSIAFRFSTVSTASFSNTVLGLSTLREFDDRPFVVVAVGPERLLCLLANSSFLKKISHSSQQLRLDNIRGSFLGHDIVRDYEGITNEPSNFERLFLTHLEFSWAENLARLVEATNDIVATGQNFSLQESDVAAMMRSLDRAMSISNRSDYLDVKEKLDSIVSKHKLAILSAAHIANINVRGNTIEQILSEATNRHDVGDLKFNLRDGTLLLVDVKTKLINLQSSPKGYNIDKVLKVLSDGLTALSFYFVAIDLTERQVATGLVSILDTRLIDATRIQFHWSGRNSRGVTQLTGNLSQFYAHGFHEEINLAKAKGWITRLTEL